MLSLEVGTKKFLYCRYKVLTLKVGTYRLPCSRYNLKYLALFDFLTGGLRGLGNTSPFSCVITYLHIIKCKMLKKNHISYFIFSFHIFHIWFHLLLIGEYCPQGTFGNTTGLRSANECIACEPGYYCPTQGHVKPYDQCNAGYYCSGGSIEANPVAKSYGYVCPVGHYCPKGTPILVPCPKGTYQPGTGI